MLVDSHCHLNFEELINKLPDVLARMHDTQVDYALTVATKKSEWSIIKNLIENHSAIYGTIGIHPDECNESSYSEEDIIQAVSHPKIVAIGETGLDYYRKQDNIGNQQKCFFAHLSAAHQTQLPLVIHSREAITDTLSLLRESKPIRGVFHCFTENHHTARKILDLGLYISISGIVTFKNAPIIHEVARFVPLDRLLIETDSPFLAPVPYRGKCNEPSYVHHVAACIATLRKISFEALATATTHNFFTLFDKIKYHG